MSPARKGKIVDSQTVTQEQQQVQHPHSGDSDSRRDIPAHASAQRQVLADFEALLEQAGFRIRGRRADCPFCEGSSRLTVAFTDEVAFCHRCKWTGNVRTLSRVLGITVAPETAQHREARTRAKQFREWRGICERILTDRFRDLGHMAERAKQVLARWPECEPAWDALADFYHAEAELSAALDLLYLEKASPWLDQPMTRERLAASFDEACIHCGEHADAA